MNNHFNFGELGGILTASKKPDIVKIASGVSGGNAPVAEAMESVCRIADALDEMGNYDLANELMASAQLLISEKIKIAKKDEDEEDEGGEADKEDLPKDREKEEVMSVTCPHCDKDFDVVVEEEDGECEVEVKDGDKDLKLDSKDLGLDDEGLGLGGPETLMVDGLPGVVKDIVNPAGMVKDVMQGQK